MNPNSQWLERFSLEFVIAQNEVLGLQKSAHHGPTSDGHLVAKELWEQAILMALVAVSVLRIWMVPPLLSSKELPPVPPMK